MGSRTADLLSEINPKLANAVNRIIKAAQKKYPQYKWTVVQGKRSLDEQAELYEIGRRGVEGETIVTKTRTGRHPTGDAVDLYPLTATGIPSYGEAQEAYEYMGRLAKELGLVWGGTKGWGGPEGDYGHIEIPAEGGPIAKTLEKIAEIRHFPKMREGDCGENAVKSILHAYGVPLEKSIADEEGTSPQKIVRTFKEKNIPAVVKSNIKFEELEPLSIAYYPGDDHYVSIESVRGNQVLVNDSSNKKPVWMGKDEFEKKWKGWVVETYPESR